MGTPNQSGGKGNQPDLLNSLAGGPQMGGKGGPQPRPQPRTVYQKGMNPQPQGSNFRAGFSDYQDPTTGKMGYQGSTGMMNLDQYNKTLGGGPPAPANTPLYNSWRQRDTQQRSTGRQY